MGGGSGHAAVQGRGQARRSCPATQGLPNAKAAEVLSKYIITDMYAKAVQGMPAEEAVEVGRGRAQEGLRLSLASSGSKPPRPAMTGGRLLPGQVRWRSAPPARSGLAPQAPRSVPRRRLLEDERWLAFVLLVPTMVLLCLFIAYPFVRGIMLSVTNSRVGVPGDFVGLGEFRARSGTTASSAGGLQHLPLYGRDHGLQAGDRPLAGAAAQSPLQGQGDHARLHPAALHHPDGALDLRLEMDVRPDLQRHQLGAVPARADQALASTGWAIPTSR